jgi:hypothetical protein
MHDIPPAFVYFLFSLVHVAMHATKVQYRNLWKTWLVSPESLADRCGIYAAETYNSTYNSKHNYVVQCYIRMFIRVSQLATYSLSCRIRWRRSKNHRGANRSWGFLDHRRERRWSRGEIQAMPIEESKKKQENWEIAWDEIPSSSLCVCFLVCDSRNSVRETSTQFMWYTYVYTYVCIICMHLGLLYVCIHKPRCIHAENAHIHNVHHTIACKILIRPKYQTRIAQWSTNTNITCIIL